MGQAFTGPGGCIIRSDDMPHVIKCVPYTKLKPFPANKRKSTGELISVFKALPTLTNTIDNAYWWLNCQFVPNDDTSLMATSAVYYLRNGLSSIHVKHTPIGKICKFTLDSPKIKCEVIRQTNSRTMPKVQVHPDSFYIFYICISELKLFHVSDDLGIHSKAYEASFRTYRSFALSPDGKRTCILIRSGRVEYDLAIFGVNTYVYREGQMLLSKLNKDYKGVPVRTELVDCKWSPDSTYVAVSISTGYVMVLNIKYGQVVCSVFPDLLDNCSLSSVAAFDFHPRSCRQIMTVGATDGCMYVVNTESKEIVCKSECCKHDSIDAIQYSPEGNTICVALDSFMLLLYSSDSCDVTYTINMTDSCPELSNLPSHGGYPSIMKLDFTRSGEQLVTCCSDGNIRVWQLPVIMDLKFICKLRILSLVCQGKITSLPLPAILKTYLLPLPVSP